MRILKAVVPISGGLALILLAFVGDTLSGAQLGFGTSQILLAAGGLLALAVGIFLLTPAGNRFLESTSVAREAFVTPREPILLGVWFGLLAGVGEILLLELYRFRVQPFVGPAPPVPWMTAATNLILFGLVGCFACLAAVRWRMKASGLLTVFGFLLLLSLALHFRQQVNGVALAILAAGLTSRLVPGAAAHWVSLIRFARRTVIPVALVATVMASARPLASWRAERRALQEVPDAMVDAPNVLLIILDTVRAANLSLYGYERGTSPELLRRAQGGITFERAISTASWTLPSHVSLLTSLYPHAFQADWGVPLEDGPRTLAEALAEHGYATGGFVANRLYASELSGLGRGFARYDAGVIRFTEFLNSISLGQTLGTHRWLLRLVGYTETLGRKPARVVTSEFLDWQAGLGERPFFAFLNYFDAHDPYLPTLQFPDARACDHDFAMSEPSVTREELQGCVDAYDGAILELDRQLAAMFRELEGRGVLGQTLVIVTSDHGEEFGERGVILHGRSLNLTSVHVPLVILLPGHVPAGLRIQAPVTLRDLPATVGDLLELGELGFQGRSLRRFWTGMDESRSADPTAASTDSSIKPAVNEAADLVLTETTGRSFLPEHNPASRGHIQAAVEGDLYLILYGDGSTELFDVASDPMGLNDLSASPEHQETVARLKEILERVADQYKRSREAG